MAWRSGNFFKQNWLSGAACTTPNKGNANRRSRKLRSEKSLKSKPAVCLSHPSGTHYWAFLDASGSQPCPGPGTNTQCPSAHITTEERRPHHTCRRSSLWSQTVGLKSWLLYVALAHSQFPTDPSTPLQGKQDSQQLEDPSSFSPPSCLQQQPPPPAPPRHRILAVVPRG